jgi:uncharacterized membrane protein
VTVRLQSIDVYRGLALLAMAIYHTLWDLNYYGLIEAGIGVDPVWLTAQRSILSSFLLLAGMSLTLAHEGGIRWRGFWKREAILIAAAALVTIVTGFVFNPSATGLWSPRYAAYFGVLHAIALFSLMALPFVRWPLWAGVMTATVFLFLPAVYQSDVFDPQALDWIGFFKNTPESADLVPIFPWFGVVLIGVIGMRVMRSLPAFTWQSGTLAVRGLALIGRWSLLFYLVHQPLIFGLVTLIGNSVNSGETAKIASFSQSCTAQCLPGHDAKFCTAYCECALDMTVRGNLWDAINATPRSPDQQHSVDAMTRLCTEMSK